MFTIPFPLRGGDRKQLYNNNNNSQVLYLYIFIIYKFFIVFNEITKMTKPITEEQFKNSLPRTLKKGVPVEVMDNINDMISQGVVGEVFKENLLNHSDILLEGKFTLDQYVNAAKYISYRALGKTMKDSYQATFPDRMTDWVARGVSGKDISTYVSVYNKSKLVIRLLSVSLAPFHLLNQPYRQEALLKQVELMRGNSSGDKDVSPMVQHLAAKSVMEILTPPDTIPTELQLTRKDAEETSELKNALRDLAKAQKEMIEKGGNLKDVAESNIVDGTFEEVK